MIVNNNHFENINNASEYFGSSGNTFVVSGFWSCPVTLPNSTGHSFNEGQLTADYYPVGLSTSGGDSSSNFWESCDLICAYSSNQCSASVGEPPTGRGNPN